MDIMVSVHEDRELALTVRDLALEGFKGPGKPQYESREKYVWLREVTSRLWLDTGDAEAAEKVWSPEIEALTTNNTLVNQVARTGALDGVVGYGARRIMEARPDIGPKDLVIEIAFLINARLALELVEKFGAHVSVELHPNTAHDVRRTVAFARRYWEIDPEHFHVKVPLTPDGFVAARILGHEGVRVNYTLGFSARQNYLAAEFAKPWFVNVFLGRLNQLVEENKLGSPDNIGEKAALASDEIIKDIRASDSDAPTRQIAASMRSGRQVVTLSGVDVLTMPPKVAEEYLQMGVRKGDIYPRNWRDLEVDLNPDRSVEANSLTQLWEISPEYISFVEDVVRQADRMESGEDLMRLARDHQIALFHEWTPEDRRGIRKKGKIPNLGDWPGVPVDDLMSVSALEAFMKDQAELDARIERLIGETLI